MQYVYANEDSIDNDLICPICTSPFDVPVFHVECGNTFCKKCTQSLKKCPICQQPLSNIIPSPKMVYSQLDKLKV